MYLSGKAGTEFYLVYFLIIGLASMSTGLKYLMINTIVFALLYGWFLHQKGLFSGDMAMSYGLRLPFMIIIAMFFGYIVEAIIKDREMSLRESEEKYRSLVESTDDSVYMVDKDCRYLSANNKLLSELAVSESDIVDKTFADFHSPAETRRFAKRVKSVFETGRAIQYEAYNEDLRKWFMLTLSPIKDPAADNVRAISVLSKDITERMHREQELREAYTKLKKTQGQLIQSEKMTAVGRLASGVAHEIRNPLEIILMGVDFLSDTLPKKDALLDECIDKMKNAVNRTNKIIGDFFQFSRTSEFELESIDVRQLLDEVISLMDHRITVSNTQIERNYPEQCVLINADKNTLQSAFMNLFTNALDAMPKGGQIKITVYNQPAGAERNKAGHGSADKSIMADKMVVVKIEDTGNGIPKDILPKIFEPFFTTKEVGTGTGLGLSTAHSIIERHEGTIDVESTANKGTTITIKLQRAKDSIREVQYGR